MLSTSKLVLHHDARVASSMSAPPISTSGSMRQWGPGVYKRAYKACEGCRKAKSKCELQPALSDHPSCIRCHREQRPCVFPLQRSTKRAKAASLARRQVSASSAEVQSLAIAEAVLIEHGSRIRERTAAARQMHGWQQTQRLLKLTSDIAVSPAKTCPLMRSPTLLRPLPAMGLRGGRPGRCRPKSQRSWNAAI